MGIKGSILGIAALAIGGFVLAKVLGGEGQALGQSISGLGSGIAGGSAGFAMGISNLIAAPVAGLTAWKNLFGLGNSPGTTGGGSGTTGGTTTTQNAWQAQGLDPLTQARAAAYGFNPNVALTTSQMILAGGL